MKTGDDGRAQYEGCINDKRRSVKRWRRKCKNKTVGGVTGEVKGC